MQRPMITVRAPELVDVATPTVIAAPAPAKRRPRPALLPTINAVAESAARFPADTPNHHMTVLHDDGLYRHLRFRDPESILYWFDLVTWPGALAINGDCGSFMFTRDMDMFSFFRRNGNERGINPGYWAEKEKTGAKTQNYSEAKLRQNVVEHFIDAVRDADAPRGLGKAIREDIFDNWEYDLEREDSAREAVANFSYREFRFVDSWEWDLTDWDWHYLWCCQAIVWGIGQYEATKATAAPASKEA